MLFTGAGYGILFDGFGQADKLLTQPLLLVAGSEAPQNKFLPHFTSKQMPIVRYQVH